MKKKFDEEIKKRGHEEVMKMRTFRYLLHYKKLGNCSFKKINKIAFSHGDKIELLYMRSAFVKKVSYF